MESQLLFLLAYNVLQPVVDALHGVLGWIYGGVHNYGWTLIILALIVKAVFWPLNSMQYKSMLKMQLNAPRIKALQQKHKGDKERLNMETMALYKETGANPMASCLPLLLQMPILFSLYAAINGDRALFASQKWLWIGTPVALASPHHILAANLAMPDYALLVLYIVSMYFQVRFSSQAVDEQQAQQQRIMSFLSPAMIGYMGFRFAWPSALIIYWLSYNVFTMAQQFYLMRRFPRTALAAASPATGSGSPGSGGGGGDNGGPSKSALPPGNATTASPQLMTKPRVAAAGGPDPKPGGGGSRAARRRRSPRR
ncbi:MAG: YidC/Oxa1 family membrane protein insertase [Candidatus Eremiobacteraeota bacterium]|nr:YidC/Oxa1 family membrane protein insertase [Candidatus Eremiobacteraeota bacterium]